MNPERKNNRSVIILSMIAGILFILFAVLCVALVRSKSGDSSSMDTFDDNPGNALSILTPDEHNTEVEGEHEKKDEVKYEDDNYNESYSNHICPTCGGNGQIITSSYVCPICGGSGWQWIPNYSYDPIMGWQGANIGCSGCGGRGRTDYQGICLDCNGSGMISY